MLGIVSRTVAYDPGLLRRPERRKAHVRVRERCGCTRGRSDGRRRSSAEPQAVAPGPSNFEAPPVPLRSFETILAEHTSTATVVARSPERDASSCGSSAASSSSSRPTPSDQAVAAARELMTCFSTAESAGEWAEVDDRFIGPPRSLRSTCSRPTRDASPASAAASRGALPSSRRRSSSRSCRAAA